MNIDLYSEAAMPVRHAVDKLREYVGNETRSNREGVPELKIRLGSSLSPDAGRQGYAIRTSGESLIRITAGHDEGIANAIFTMLRTLMIENRKDPFKLHWNSAEKPWFAVRNINVAPYRFGGSFGYAVLSPDRWSLDEWIQYIDFLRLCNMTSLTLNAGGRLYHPDYPQTTREKWRYDVWKDVIEYCHRVGIKVNWLACPGMVPQETFWRNPELRPVRQEAGGYYGCGIQWTKAKQLILDIYRYTLEYLPGLDGQEMIYSEAGFSFDDKTSSDPAGYFADVTRSYRDLMRQVGNSGEYFFWNWLFDLWSEVVLPESLLTKYPKYRTLLDDLIPLLPRDIAWIDASMLSTIQMFGPEIRARGNPGLREGLLLGREHGFSPVIDCFWYMNPEYTLNILPHPYIGRAIQEAHYARDELKCDGVAGYRLAPPCRFLGDYTFARLASDPSLSEGRLVSEMAAMLSTRPENRKSAEKAVNLLEKFWTTHEIDAIVSAEEAFSAARSGESSQSLAYVADGTTFLSYVVKMSQPGLSGKKLIDLKSELYERLKSMFIFQGFTSDICWQPESFARFSGTVDLMVRQYNWYRTSRPDVIDRSIYPEATTRRFRLNWPHELTAETHSTEGFFAPTGGPLTPL